MTDYPVQCYEHNGEPYGRYKNPNPRPLDDKEYLEWMKFESFAESNTFPFPSGTIGKTYDRDEVEVASQAWEFDWVDATLTIDQYKSIGFDTRQIFRLLPHPVDHSKSSESCNQTYLLSENDRQDQPVEKEPVSMKKVKCDKCYGSGFYSSKYGQAACEKCNNGYVFKEVRKRKTKAKRAVEKEPETVEQAAERCISDMLSVFGDIKCPEGLRKDFIGMFKAGAEWQKTTIKIK